MMEEVQDGARICLQWDIRTCIRATIKSNKCVNQIDVHCTILYIVNLKLPEFSPSTRNCLSSKNQNWYKFINKRARSFLEMTPLFHNHWLQKTIGQLKRVAFLLEIYLRSYVCNIRT